MRTARSDIVRTDAVRMDAVRTDAVIIGAGVIGAAIAYHLSRHKLRVTLLEQGGIAAGSSGACDGLVFLQSKKPGIHLELAMESRRRFERLAGTLPVDIEYRPSGGMVVAENEAQMGALAQYAAAQQAIGLKVGLLDGTQARRLEPRLADELAGATHCPQDGQVNPIALTLGFVASVIVTPGQSPEPRGGRDLPP